MRLCVGIYPQEGEGQNLTIDTITADQPVLALAQMENWRSMMETLHLSGFNLRRVTGTITGTNLFVFTTRNNVQGVLQITGFTENPRGVKVR